MTDTKTTPVNKYSTGGISVAVWENEFEGRKTYSATIKKNYKDMKTGDWKETKNFTPKDAMALAALLEQYYRDYLVKKE